VAYSTEDARNRLLGDVAAAVDSLALALACLTEAYEELDEEAADRLEEALFRPVQAAYGRLRRTHTEFAERYGLRKVSFAARSAGLHSADPRVYIERAIEAAEVADHQIAELQDSMMPVEVGDTELRSGLSQTRTAIGEVPARGRQLLRTFGR
jgi:hypothetical protein